MGNAGSTSLPILCTSGNQNIDIFYVVDHIDSNAEAIFRFLQQEVVDWVQELPEDPFYKFSSPVVLFKCSDRDPTIHELGKIKPQLTHLGLFQLIQRIKDPYIPIIMNCIDNELVSHVKIMYIHLKFKKER